MIDAAGVAGNGALDGSWRPLPPKTGLSFPDSLRILIPSVSRSFRRDKVRSTITTEPTMVSDGHYSDLPTGLPRPSSSVCITSAESAGYAELEVQSTNLIRASLCLGPAIGQREPRFRPSDGPCDTATRAVQIQNAFDAGKAHMYVMRVASQPALAWKALLRNAVATAWKSDYSLSHLRSDQNHRRPRIQCSWIVWVGVSAWRPSAGSHCCSPPGSDFILRPYLLWIDCSAFCSPGRRVLQFSTWRRTSC